MTSAQETFTYEELLSEGSKPPPYDAEELDGMIAHVLETEGREGYVRLVLGSQWTRIIDELATWSLIAGISLPFHVSHAAGFIRLSAQVYPNIAKKITLQGRKRILAKRALNRPGIEERTARNARAIINRSRPRGRPAKEKPPK